jgi:hypothetical protein
MSTERETSAAVTHVAVRMPEFWVDNPVRWFGRIESQFRLAKITSSSTMFDHTLSYLPERVCSSISHILDDINPSAADSYDRLKAALTKRYTKSRWERAFELIKLPGLGDMKPSELMRQMLTLLPEDDTPKTTFMAMFLLRLPTDMRDHIVAKDFDDPRKMAEHADLLHAGRTPAAITAVTDDEFVCAVSSNRRRDFSPKDSRRRSPSRQGRSRRQTPAARGGDDSFCYFHNTFGDKAKKCKPGCSWSGNGSAAGN